jgi:pyridoxal biosynthesis lyase PdxS
MGNIVEDLCNEELHGEMNYISEDGVEGFVGESGYDSMNEEKNEKNIVEAMKRLVAKFFLNKIKRTITKEMYLGMMTQCMAMV